MDGTRIWLTGLAAACLLLSFMVSPASPDELDTLLLVQEAQPLRDQWQACAAGFARSRLNSKLTAERLAETAFRNCRSRESRLRTFIARKTGRRKADAVVLLIREQDLSALTEAIEELRSRN